MGSYYISIKKPFEGDVFALRDKLGTYRKVYDYLVSKGYDGIIDTEMGDGFHEYIVFKPEQIKSATDNIGTYDGDNPDIRYRINKTAEQTETIAGRNLQNDLLNFSAGEGIRNRQYNVVQMIREAYTLFDDGNTHEGEVKLYDAAEEYTRNVKAYINPKNEKAEDGRNSLINRFIKEFENNYRAGKRYELVNSKDALSLSDIKEFNFNIRKYLFEYVLSESVFDDMFNDGFPYIEQSARKGFELLKNGASEAEARKAFHAAASIIAEQAMAYEYNPNENEVVTSRSNGKYVYKYKTAEEKAAAAKQITDNMIQFYHDEQPVSLKGNPDTAAADRQKYGSEIEKPFRATDIKGMTEGEVRKLSDTVRSIVNQIVEKGSSPSTHCRDIDKAIYNATAGRSRSADDILTLTATTLDSVYARAKHIIGKEHQIALDALNKAATDGEGDDVLSPMRARVNAAKVRMAELDGYISTENNHFRYSNVYTKTIGRDRGSDNVRETVGNRSADFMYRVFTDGDANNMADEYLQTHTLETAIVEFENGETGKYNTVLGSKLFYMLDNMGEYDRAADILLALQKRLTNAGQATQAFSMFYKMSPVGAMMAIERDYTNSLQRAFDRTNNGDELRKQYETLIEEEAAEKRKVHEDLLMNDPEYKELNDKLEAEKQKLKEEVHRLEILAEKRRAVEDERTKIRATANEITKESQALAIEIAKRAEDRINAKFQKQMDTGKQAMRIAGLTDKQINDAVLEAMRRTKDGDFFFADNWAENAIEKAYVVKEYSEAQETMQALQRQSHILLTEIRERADGEYKALKAKQAGGKVLKNKVDTFLDKLNIEHIGAEDLNTYREILLAIRYADTPDEMIDMILRLSDRRNTAKQLVDTVYDTGRSVKRFVGKMAGKDVSADVKEYSKRGFLTKALNGVVADYQKRIDEVQAEVDEYDAKIERLTDELAEAVDRAIINGADPKNPRSRECDELYDRIRQLQNMSANAWDEFRIPGMDKQPVAADGLKNIAIQQVFGAVLDADKRAFGEKLSTARYISQLLCATTLERNIISNTGFAFIDSLANNTAWVIDNLIALKTKRRTVGFENPFGGIKAGLKQARDSYLEQALNVDILHHDTSYLGPTKRKRTFTSKHMAGLERGLGYALSVPDEFYKGMAEERVRNSLEKIKKYCAFTDEDINTIAEDMAKYRTFQDDTALAKLLDSLKHDSLNRMGMYGFGLGDFILPYTAVPANLVMRSVEYNPVGGLKAVYDLLMIFGGGDVMGHSPATSDEAIEFKRKIAPGLKRFKGEKNVTDNAMLLTPLMQRRLAFDIARPLTGSMLLFLGANLRASGIIVGDEEDDEYNEEQYKKSKNANEYRINISALERLINGENADAQNGDTLLNYGWFTPISTSLNMGAAITDKGEWNAGNFAKASGNELLKQFEDLPAFSSVYSVIRNRENSEGSFVNFTAATGGDFVLSFYPSLLNQFGNSLDSYGRTPYKSDNPWEIFLNKIKVKSPILPIREDVPMRVDLFGQVVNNSLGSTGADMANNMLAPFKLSKFKSNELTDELDKLIKISPDVVPKSPYREYNFTEDGTKYSFKLNDLDYQNFSILLGQTTYNNMLAFKHSDGYEKLSEQEKINGYEEISRNTIYTVRHAWALMKEGKDNKEVTKLLNDDLEKYEQQAGNVAKKSDVYNYLSQDGAKVEDVIIVTNPIDYPDTTVKGKTEYNNECIDKIKKGEFYEYRYNKYGEEYKSYSKNWTEEERYDKILYYRNLNKRLADGSLKDNSDIITGSYNELSDYEKKLVDTNIERNITTLSVPYTAKQSGAKTAAHTAVKDVTNDAEGVNTAETLSDLGFNVPKQSQDKNRIVFKSVIKAAEQAKNAMQGAVKLSEAAADAVKRENEYKKSSAESQRRKFTSYYKRGYYKYYKRRYYRKGGYGRSGYNRIKFVPRIYETNSSRFGNRFGKRF